MAQSLIFDTETNTYQAIPADIAPQIFSNPRYHVPLNDPDGQLVTLPYFDAQNYLSKDVGYSQPTQTQLYSLLQSSIYNTPEERIKGFAENLTKGAIPFGVGTKALIELGDKPENIRKREMFQPGWIKFAGETAGLIGSEFIPGGQARVMEKAGLGALKLFGLGAKEGEVLSLAQRINRGALKEAMEFGILGTGDALSHMMIQDPKSTSENVMAYLGDEILTSAMIGGLFGAAKPIIAAPFKLAKDVALEKTLKRIQDDSNPDKMSNEIELAPILKKFLSVVGGPSVETQEKLLRYNDIINAENAEEFQDVYQWLFEHRSKLDEDVLNKKITVNEYNEKLKDLKKDLKKEIYSQIKDKQEAFYKWESIYSQVKNESIKNIKTNAVSQDKPIFEAIQEIGQKAFKSAQEAMDVLVQADEKVNLENLVERFTKEIELRRSQESTLSHNIADYLTNHVNRILEGPLEVPAERAKRILQGIGQEGFTKGVRNPVESELSSFYKGTYTFFSDYLKDTFKEYAEKIKPSADLMKILEQLKDFGYKDEQSIRNKIGTLISKDGLNAPPQIELLKKVESNSKEKFIEPIEAYVNLTKNKDFTGTHEYQAWMNEGISAARFEDLKTKLDLEKLLKNTEDVETWKKSIDELGLDIEVKDYLNELIKRTQYFEIDQVAKKANAELADSLAKIEEIKGLTRENVQPFLQRAMKGKDIKTMQILEKLPKMNEKDLKTILQAIHVRQQFEKGFMNGSRMTLGWKTLITALLGAKYGWLGVLLGWTADKYAPAVTKNILDGYVKMFGDLTTEAGAKDANALRIMMYKFLSGGAPVNPAAFKGGLKYLEAASKAQVKIRKQVTDAFDPTIKVAAIDYAREKEKRETFEKKVANIDFSKAIEADNQVAYYMPDHGASIVSTIAGIGQYLRQNYPQGPLIAGKRQISFADQSKYNRTVDIARNPLIIIDHFKQGNLLPKDVIDINAMYPNLFKQIQKNFLDQMIDLKLKNKDLTQSQKLGLSIILDSPIDPNLKPQNILSMQSRFQQPQMQNGSIGALKSLKKLPGLEQTQGQRAEAQ
jgi:hypothetical protein